MPVSPSDLFAFLDSHGIAHETFEHPPIFTAEQGRALEAQIPGLACKNLFLKDKKDRWWLIVMPAEKRADLAVAAKKLGAGRFSFGRPEDMERLLGVSPGSATPFAIMNDTSKTVTVVLDSAMVREEKLSFHPLHNAASTVIAAQDLLKFFDKLGREPILLECEEA